MDLLTRTNKMIIIAHRASYASKSSFRLCESKSENGFTLIEIVIAATLLALSVGAVATTLTIGNNALSTTRRSSDLEAAVNTNLAAIKDVAYRLTCCPGSCTATQATIVASSSCTSKDPGSQNYYFPDPSVGTTQIDSFVARCYPTGPFSPNLVGSLITAINDDFSSSAALPAGVTRSLNQTAAARNRLIVTYSNSSESKSYTVIPAVGAWCP